MTEPTVTAVLIALVLIAAFAAWRLEYGEAKAAASAAGEAKAPFTGAGEGFRPAAKPLQKENRGRMGIPYAEGTVGREGMAVSPGEMDWSDAPERRSVYAALAKPYSTADVDPMITGQLYSFSDGVRNVYAERSSHGDGLDEYSASGGSGDVGVDVGPYGLDEYGGKEVGFDDGIPAQWAMPSTPVRWYAPKQRDYYGVEGPTVYAEGLYQTTQPDHLPLMP